MVRNGTGSGPGEFAGADAAIRVDDEDIAVNNGTERLERPGDLPLPIESAHETVGEIAGEIDGEICHVDQKYTVGQPRTTAGVPISVGDGTARGRIAPMTTPARPAGMPAGIRLFLGYALVILGLVGLSLRFVVDEAISAPVSGVGVVVMALLAYTIFTTTLVIQRKEASRNLALGLASLTVPGVPLAWFTFSRGPLGIVLAGAVLLLAVGLFRGLTRESVRAWLDEP